MASLGRPAEEFTFAAVEEIPVQRLQNCQNSNGKDFTHTEAGKPASAVAAASPERSLTGVLCAACPTSKCIGAHRLRDVLQRDKAEVAAPEARGETSHADRRLQRGKSRLVWLTPSSRAAMLTQSPIRSPSALLHHVAKVNTDPRLDTSFGTSSYCVRSFLFEYDPATRRIDHAAKFRDKTVASAFDDAAMMRGDCGIDRIAA